MRIVLVDLLCMTPVYDKYLFQGLRTCGKEVIESLDFAVIAFHRDPTFFTGSGIPKMPGIIDIVEHLRVRNTVLRRVLKGIEYVINLAALGVRFVYRKPHIIHIQWLPLLPYLPIEWWFINLCKAVCIKLVYTVHNVLPHDTGNKYADTFRRLYHKVDALICHTQASKEKLQRDFGVPPEKIWVIPHGGMFADVPELSQSEARRIIGLEEKQSIVLFFGSVRPYKGVEFLLEAWKNVVQRQPHATLILAGGGDPKYIRHISNRIEQLGITTSVEQHLHFVPMSLLPAYHWAADVLVYPYKSIDQSGALLTGMAFKKPIIATCTDGFRETLRNGDTGILVPYGDVCGLVDALVYLLQNPSERVRLGHAARKELDERYSWNTVAQKTLECYQTLVYNA